MRNEAVQVRSGMNLAWIIVLTLIVLAEKLLPAESVWPSRVLGAGLVIWGGYVLLAVQGG